MTARTAGPARCLNSISRACACGSTDVPFFRAHGLRRTAAFLVISEPHPATAPTRGLTCLVDTLLRRPGHWKYPVPGVRGRVAMTVAEQAAETTDQGPVQTRALIIGTGFSGLGIGIALQEQGVDFLILEKADDVGGTWRDNSYPGCACDVPSHLYSFSFSRRRHGANCSLRSLRSGTTSRESPTSTGCAATSGSTRASPARTGTIPSSAGTCSPTPGRNTSRSSSFLGPARCTSRCPKSKESPNSMAPLSIPRSGTTASTSAESGSR